MRLASIVENCLILLFTLGACIKQVPLALSLVGPGVLQDAMLHYPHDC